MKKKIKWIIPAIAIVILMSVGVFVFFQKKEEKVYTDPRDIPIIQNNPVYHDEDDTDGDGLLNKEEKELGTNILLVDTDEDNIDDFSEVYGSKTDPLNSDTDKDGLKDGIELFMELNPLEKKTDGKTLIKKELLQKNTQKRSVL